MISAPGYDPKGPVPGLGLCYAVCCALCCALCRTLCCVLCSGMYDAMCCGMYCAVCCTACCATCCDMFYSMQAHYVRLYVRLCMYIGDALTVWCAAACVVACGCDSTFAVWVCFYLSKGSESASSIRRRGSCNGEGFLNTKGRFHVMAS